MDGIKLPAEILKAIERGATIVTSNQRAARTLRRAFDRHNRDLGLASWRPADVVSWDAWTARLWRRLLMDGHASQLLLNRTQEHAIWRNVLIADPELRSLRSKDSLAEMAAEAWHRLCSYNGQGRLRSAAGSSDTRAFQRWATEFQRRCRDGGLLPQAELSETLRDAAGNKQLRLESGEVLRVGFDRMTPAQAALTDAVRSMGCAVDELQIAMPEKSRLLVHATDESEEMFAAARWARSFLEEHPTAQVAVIVPALEKHRAEIDRVFREVLAPESQDIAAPDDAVPYEFSLGVSLARTQMVAAALDLLRWANGPLPIEWVSALLLSPYFAMSNGERSARGEFDAFELRKTQRLRPEISLDSLSAAAERSPRRHQLGRLPAALASMRRIAAMHLKPSELRSHTEWAERMREMLQSAHWGVANESSIEFQVRRKWESALDEMATLDFDSSGATFERALESLERITQQTMFAPESREAPIQVMGAFEAAGARFDAVWFLHCGDLNWPAAASLTPLLPWHLQRDLGMPGTDVKRDGEDARRTIERIASSAGTAIFSYAAESAEGTQRPSPALAGLTLHETDAQTLTGKAPEHSIIALETIEDTDKVQALPDRIIRGGAQILKLQAACGFRAFAEQRLWSTEVEPQELGMDARQRGNAVHHVLEIFWNEVKTQSVLKQMPANERLSLLDRCIALGLGKVAAPSETLWDAAYLQMQSTRLRSLLKAWLELELTRPPFEVKLSEMEVDDVPVGPLRLRVRIDRVDLVEGGELLIDYKTGDAKPNAWLTERPDEPQLPLYATLRDPKQLKGVAFGIVRAGESMDMTGYSVSPHLLPHPSKMTTPSLEAQVEDWKRVLVSLAIDFHSGNATVDPKKYPTTCKHCTQRILCRLDTTLLEDDENASAVEVFRG